MLSFLTRRLALGLLTLWAVSVLIFVSTQLLPGDVASAILGQDRTPEAEHAIRVALGLDQPAIQRYATWFFGFIRGDMGQSLANGRDIATEVGWRLKNTLFLAGTVAVLVVPLAIGFGLLTATLQNSFVDKIVNIAGLAFISLPDFFVGYILIFVFSVRLGLFPSLAMLNEKSSLASNLYSIALPVMTLMLGVFAYMMRLTRAATIAVLDRPFIEMAILKGVPRWRIVCQHALPNAFAPIINVVAQNLAHLIVAVVVVEVIFVYPGMGQLMVDAVLKRDVPMVQSCGLIFATVYVTLNLIADWLVIISNPRLRHSR